MVRQLRQQLPGQAQRIEKIVPQRPSKPLFKGIIKKIHIELYIVSQKDPIFQKGMGLRKDFFRARSILQHLVRNAGQPCNKGIGIGIPHLAELADLLFGRTD